MTGPHKLPWLDVPAGENVVQPRSCFDYIVYRYINVFEAVF
jgi:hypothetical protein